MRGDPQVELQGAVLVGRRIAPATRVEDRKSIGVAITDGEMVTVTGIVLRIGPGGLTVLGPDPDVVHTVVWQRVKGLHGGELARFLDGSPARSIDVELDDRNVKFLIPAEVLNDDRLRTMHEIAVAHGARSRFASLRDTPGAPMRDPRPAADAKAPEAEAADGFVTGGQREPSNVALPPPPPRSKVAMPPAPSDAGASAPGRTGENTSEFAGTPSLVEGLFQLPLAVPPARRVELPRRLLDQAVSSDPPQAELVDRSRLGHIPPLLPPPPPRGSWSQLPPSPESDEPPSAQEPDEHDLVEQGLVSVPSIPPSGTGREDPSGSGPLRTATGTQGATEHRRVARADRKQTRRRAALGAGFVVVLAGGAIVGLSVTGQGGGQSAAGTTTTLGPSTRGSSGGAPHVLTGPPAGAPQKTVAGALNIVAADLPKGWQTGSAPWSRVGTSQADSALAGCLGVPVTHLGVVTGSTPSGGPLVYASGWITSPGAHKEGFESAVALDQNAATHESDLAALDAGGAASCLQGWYASLDVSGDAIVGVPTVTALSVTAPSGESAAGFDVSVVTRTAGGAQSSVNEELVVIGVGRVEVGLVSESVGGPLNPSLEAFVLGGLESRLGAVAAS